MTIKNIPVGYKDSPLGIIPQEWEVKRLGELSEINPSKGEITSKFVTFLAMSDISEQGRVMNENIVSTDSIKSGFTPFKRNDIIVAKITPCFENGKGALLNNITEEYGFGSTEFHVIRCQQCNRFIYYHTISYPFRKRLESQMTGSAGQKRVSADSISSYKIPLPPLAEQEKIAEILGTLDKAIEKQIQLIEKLELRKKGLMQQLLTGKKRLPGFSDPWKELKINRITTIKKGEQVNKDVLFSNAKYPVINGGISPSGYLDTYNTKANTITISEGGNSCGYVNFMTTPFWSGGHCYTIDAKDGINNLFIYQLLKNNEKYIMSLRVGSGLPNIQIKDLGNLKFVIPAYQEQTAIAEVLTSADREIELAQQKLELLRQQKRGLMQQLLTGKKRVKV